MNKNSNRKTLKILHLCHKQTRLISMIVVFCMMGSMFTGAKTVFADPTLVLKEIVSLGVIDTAPYHVHQPGQQFSVDVKPSLAVGDDISTSVKSLNSLFLSLFLSQHLLL